MTQPPEGEPQRPDPGPNGRPPPHAPVEYPKQQLLPHEVQPGRSRKPLIIGLVVVVALVAGGVTTWLLVRDTGEETRADYCSALRQVTDNGDLVSAFGNADAKTFDEVEHVRDLAPQAVRDDWDYLVGLVQTAQQGEPGVGAALEAFGHLRSISTDADDNCGLSLDLPSL